MEKVKSEVRPKSKAPPPKKLNNKVFAPFHFDTKNYWYYYTEIKKD